MRERLYELIFEADTRTGKIFDVVLLISILASVLAVMLESVSEIRERHGELLRALEWAFTALFTIEYGLRLFCVRRPLRYAFSFFGLVDLMAVLPAYLSLLLGSSPSLAVVRILRMVRVFRVLKLVRFLGEAEELKRAIKSSIPKITVFMVVVMSLVVIIGTAIYLIEGTTNDDFSSIPQSMYWAIVTVTTVGYGDITPQTTPGQILSAVLMIFGYALLAVPTGVVAAEFVRVPSKKAVTTQVCPNCLCEGHDDDAKYCKFCGSPM